MLTTRQMQDEILRIKKENDICITISNSNCKYSMYIDLEDGGEFTLSYYKWHTHYFGEKEDYNRLCADLTDILRNNKCVIVINSNKRWLYDCWTNIF